MLEKFESLQLLGFESLKQLHIKYLEDKLKKKDNQINESKIDGIKFMNVEEWEKSLTDSEKRKVNKRTQDQRKILKRILESDLGLIDEQEMYDEIKYRKSIKGPSKFIPNIRFNKSVSAPDMSKGYSGMENTNNKFSSPFNYERPSIITPPMKRFNNIIDTDPNSQSFRQPVSEFEPNDSFNLNRDSYYDTYRPYYRPSMPHVFLDECCYNIDRKKMNDIAENVDRYFNELPSEVRYADVAANEETDELNDSTYYPYYKDRRSSSSSRYNNGLLNELYSKIKS